MLKDNASIKGIVNLVLRDQHGRVKQHKTIRNAVTEDGIAHIIGRMIDTNQDRNGKDGAKQHILPRMMSHMGIGTGNNASTAGSSSVVTASTTNRFLQTEIGSRVQVMKDTSRTSDYAAYDLVFPAAPQVDNAAANYNPIEVGQTSIKLATGSASTGTLRSGMTVTLADYIPVGTVIGTVTNGDNGVSTITLLDAAGNPQAVQGGPNSDPSGTAVSSASNVTFAYTGVVESLTAGASGHPFRGKAGGTDDDPALDVTDYYAGLRGKVGAYYDTASSPADVAANSRLAPFVGENADKPSINFTQFGTDIDGIFQGTRVGTSIVEDAGTATEGYHPDENDWNRVPAPVSSGAPNAQRGSKKTGNRIVFIATFKEENPNQATTLVREAGIFNSRIPHRGYDTSSTYAATGLTGSNAGYTAANTEGDLIDAVGGGAQVREFSAGSPRGGEINQSMLCRTTFDVVTKAQLDTLQITWSVQLADQTP